MEYARNTMPSAVVTSGVVSVHFNNVKVFFIVSLSVVGFFFNYFLLKK